MLEFKVDVSALTGADRLGVAACRLACYEWDEILGPKPEGFDELPEYRGNRFFFGRKKASKQDYVMPAYAAIEDAIGEANVTRCWWKYVLGKSEEEWLRWHVNKYVTAFQRTKR